MKSKKIPEMLVNDIKTFKALLINGSVIKDPTLYRIPEDWNDQNSVPHAEEPGVYCFFDGTEKLLYIGKSERFLGARVCAHCRMDKDKNKMDYDRDELKATCCVALIPITHDSAFLAPALEAYLQRKHRPEGNKDRKWD